MTNEVTAAAPAAPVEPTISAPAASSAPAPAAGGSEAAPNPAESAPATPAPEGAKKPDTPDPSAEKRGNSRFERRISRLHREAAEARAERDLYRRQFEEARQQQPAAADPHAPRIESFDDIEKYAAAKAKYESDKTLREHTAKQHAETAKQHQARLSAEWEDRVERAADKYEDWTDVVGEIKPTNPVSVAIMRAENGEDIAYHLGKNPKEAQRIVGLQDPIQQVFELGRLAAKLAAEPKKPAQPSKAPAPINPLSGGTTQPTGEPDSNDVGAWIKWRQHQVHGTRAR